MRKQSNRPSAKAWRRLKRNKPALFGMGWILFMVLVAIGGYSIAPDSTPHCDNQAVRIKLQRPGFSCDFLKVRKNMDVPRRMFPLSMIKGQESEFKWIPIEKWVQENDTLQVTAYGGGTLYFHILDVLNHISGIKSDTTNSEIAYVVTYPDGREESLTSTSIPAFDASSHIVCKTFYLGTDNFGRDILSRLILGTRISLVVGLIAVVISLLIGISMGLFSGYFGGWVDDAIMFLVNTVWSIPTLLLVFAIVLAFGRGVGIIFLAVGLTMWVDVSRIVRGQVLAVKQMQYIEAAKAFGFGTFRTLFRHILPNVLGPVMVIAAANFATAILLEAGLGYLGFGVQPPAPSWGTMLNENYGYAISGKPLLALVPAMAVMLLVLSFNLLGNGLRDALDVTSHN